MEQNIAFNRCMDFLSRMIEKYGQELLDEINTDTEKESESKMESVKLQSFKNYI